MNTDQILELVVLSVEPARNLARVDAVDAELLIDGSPCGVTLIPAWTPAALSMVAWGDLPNWADSNTRAAIGHLGPATMHEIESVVSEAAEAAKIGAWIPDAPTRWPPTVDASGYVPRSLLAAHIVPAGLDGTPEQHELVEALHAAGVKLCRFDHYGEFARWAAGCFDVYRDGLRLSLWTDTPHELADNAIGQLCAIVPKLLAEGWTLDESAESMRAGPALETLERSDADTIARALADALGEQPELAGLIVRSGPDGAVIFRGTVDNLIERDAAAKILESVNLPAELLAGAQPGGLAVVDGEG